MSIFVVNFGFSTQAGYPTQGNFQPDNQNSNSLLRSCVWLQYTAGGAPNLTDTFYQYTAPLASAQWAYVSGTSSALQVYDGDIVAVRVFNADGVNMNDTLLLAAVFGQGSGSELVAPPTYLQSPLLINNLPRTVLDSVDINSFNPQNWATPSTDGAWTFVVGYVHGAANQYSFNVGVSVCMNPAMGSPVYQYGHDPKMRVGMVMGRGKCHDDRDKGAAA